MYRRNELREYETKITLKKINAALRSWKREDYNNKTASC
jgi:hypothetical protein